MKQRIITGTIMAIVVLLCILFLSPSLFRSALLAVCLVGVYEWSKMLADPYRVPFLIGNVVIFLGAFALFFTYFSNVFSYYLALVSCVWIAMPFILKMHTKSPQTWLYLPIPSMVLMTLMLLGFFVALSILIADKYYLMYVIALVAMTDSGAYFVGRKFGKHKLAPTISPGKTVEGAIGGLSLALILSVVVAGFSFYDKGIMAILGFVMISLISAILSISGDLYESLMKRHAGLKDSGNILPGHGGVLDRIDGLIPGATFFTFGLYLLS